MEKAIKLFLNIVLLQLVIGVSFASLKAQNHSKSVIIGGMTDFKEGGIVTLGMEMHSIFQSSKIGPVIFLAHDFTRENWEDNSKGYYRAFHIGTGLRTSSKEFGFGFFFEPQITYSHLSLLVEQQEINDKTDSGGSFGLGFLYGYRFKMFEEILFIEPALYGGFNFSDISLATDPFPYNRKPEVIDWHSWNKTSKFSLMNTFLIRIGMHF